MSRITFSYEEPLFHVIYGLMAFSYLINLPKERRHLAHLEELERQGAAGAAHH